MTKISVGILGATGIVGQQYVSQLENHPWFSINFLAASPQSKGKTYEQATQNRWHLEKRHSLEKVKNMPVYSIDDLEIAKKHCSVLFSALPKKVALIYEPIYAQAGFAIISSASAFRTNEHVPILIPEINADHLAIIDKQQKNNGWAGFIVAKPNCSIQSFMIPLDPLHKKFKIKQLTVTTLQAISGAGYPGVSSYDLIDNIIPYIEGEEEKSQNEPLKIWGHIDNNKLCDNHTMTISSQCNRIPLIHGHTACVKAKFEITPSIEEVREIWHHYLSDIHQLHLPTAPSQTIYYCEDDNRPQPRLDRDSDKGMAITVGRLTKCNVMDIRFVGLSHNTIRGAAGGGVLIGELLYKSGKIW